MESQRLRLTVHLLLFLCGFSLTASWIGSMVPERLRLQWFDSVRSEVDVVFIGSSHVYRQFDPVLFDTARGVEKGEPYSINFGDLGMGLGEEIYLAERVLASRPPQLAWLILEGLPFEIPQLRSNDFSVRQLEWHSARITWMTLRAAWSEDLPWAEKWPKLCAHIEHWWRRSLNQARGFEVVANGRQVRFAADADLAELGAGGRGYFPLEEATANARSMDHRKRFLNRKLQLAEARATLVVAGDGGAPSPAQHAAVVAIEKLAAAQGVQIIWWLHPNLKRYEGWRQLQKSGAIAHLVAFDNPELYPRFYQRRWRFDAFHLNRAGSEFMTERFCREFVRLTKESAGSLRH